MQVRRRRMLGCTAETKSAVAQTQVGTSGGGLGQGIGIAGNKVEQLGEAAQDVAIMSDSKNSRECRGSNRRQQCTRGDAQNNSSSHET